MGLPVLCPPVDSSVSHSACSTDEADDVLPEPDTRHAAERVGGLFVGNRARTAATPTQDRGGSCMSRTEWLGEPAIVLGVKILRARRTL
jgi:hypothetical protein